MFRRHVRNVYRALDRPIPEDLFVTNITTETPYVAVDPPTGFIEPALDGEVTSYFEWIGAGCVVTTMAAGTMQQVDASRGRIMLIEFGFNLDYLWVRIDADVPMRTFMEPGVQVRMTFVSPAGIQVVVTPGGVRLERRQPGAAWQPSPCEGLGAAAGQILEVRIPFACLELPPGARVGFVVGVDKGEMETVHYPPHTPIEFGLPDREFPAQSWTT